MNHFLRTLVKTVSMSGWSPGRATRSEDLDALLGELDADAADCVLEPVHHPP